MHDWPWHWHMGWMMMWWGLGGVVFVAFLLWLTSSTRMNGSAEAELKRRYARGEIEREEYQQRLADLRQ